MAQDSSPLAPPAPLGWEAVADTLIRLTNHDGDAIAWIAPQYGANCVAFVTYAHGKWVQVLHNEGHDALAARPSRFGCAVLFPFPGHMQDFRYHWQGEIFTIPRNGSTAAGFGHGFTHTRPWQVADVTTSRAMMTFSTHDALTADEHAGYPFDIRLTETVALVETRLRISLHAVNEGGNVAPVGLGLHPYFPVATLGGNRAQVAVRLPGREEHVLMPAIPTGEKRPVTSPSIAVPAMPDTAHVARTTLERHPYAALSGDSSGDTILFTFVEGVRDVMCFTPPDQPSISVEPLSCAPSAASQAEGHPDGLVPLAPGAGMTMTVEISLETTTGTR